MESGSTSSPSGSLPDTDGLTSDLSPLTSHLSPLSPLTSHLSPLTLTRCEQVTSYALSKGLHWKTLHALQEFCAEQEELMKKIPPGDNVLYRLSPRLIEDVMLQVHAIYMHGPCHGPCHMCARAHRCMHAWACIHMHACICMHVPRQVHGQWLVKLPFAAYLLRPPPIFTKPGPVYGYSAASVARSAIPPFRPS